MSKLTELNTAINALNELWPLLDAGDKQRDKILEERKKLNAQASELAHKTLLEGVPELNDAIEQLNLVTKAAKEAKESIDDVAKRINSVADTIDKAVSAVGKVAALMAVL